MTDMPKINVNDPHQATFVRNWISAAKPGFRLEVRNSSDLLGDIFSGFFGTPNETKATEGVWAAYDTTGGNAAVIFPTEIEALRHALQNTGMSARNVQWGRDVFTPDEAYDTTPEDQ